MTFKIKENEIMVVMLGHRPPKYPKLGELLQQKYAVTRDEMLWREYASNKTLGDPESLKHALSVLQVLRETPE
jgi:hypothetical protein